MDNLYYRKYYSSIGKIFIAFSDEGIVKVSLGKVKEDDFLWDLMICSPICKIVEKNLPEPTHKELDSYFNGEPVTFSLPVNFISGTEFQIRIWKEITKIPYGKLLSYSCLAKRIGSPRAVRAVGSALNANPVSIIVPCHRIVNKNGKLGGFGLGLAVKKKLLRIEGIRISKDLSPYFLNDS